MRRHTFTRRSSSPSRKRGDFAYLGFWLGHGLSVRAATAAAAAGCRSLNELRDLGWRAFQHQNNCGSKTLKELSELVGGWPDAPCKDSRTKRLQEMSMIAVRPSDVLRNYHAWVRRASDDALIEELHLRGIAVESDKQTYQR